MVSRTFKTIKMKILTIIWLLIIVACILEAIFEEGDIIKTDNIKLIFE